MGIMAKALEDHLRKQKCRPRVLRHDETKIQIEVVNYLKIKFPNVLFTISPNGMKLPMLVAKRMKAMGYRAGTPDLIILEPRDDHHGLFIELKTRTGTASYQQEDFMKMANARGYKVAMCRGYNEAVFQLE
jgi:hypothetical protein